MPRRLHNWTYPDVTRFLREHGFNFHKELGGSHQSWSRPGVDDESDRIVTVNFTHGSYPVKTLLTMIRQSGISAAEWIDWADS